MPIKTIGELKKELEKYPDDYEWTAYEGERTGITICDCEAGWEAGFIPDVNDRRADIIPVVTGITKMDSALGRTAEEWMGMYQVAADRADKLDIDRELYRAARKEWYERAIAAEAKVTKMRSRIAQIHNDWHVYVPCRCEFYINGAVKCGGCIIRESLAELDK